MYLPYLRGKQFELLALREFAAQNPDTRCIVPIIEPVKSTLNGLSTAIKAMFDKHLRFSLILNPNEGDFSRISKSIDILSEIPSLVENKDGWIPAFLYQGDTSAILSIIHDHGMNGVMIVFKNGLEDNERIWSFLSDPRIKYIVNSDTNSRLVLRQLRKMGDKYIIRLDNNFNEQTRNVDYLNTPDEKFTEEHRFYTEDRYYGFADYTVLPKNFVDGGMMPYAVAIHLTYEKNKDEIYVRHFVSDTNFDQSNVAGKFFEAASKVQAFFSGKDKTPAINELINYLNGKLYPGLGVIKKLSIKSHIELINNILSESL